MSLVSTDSICPTDSTCCVLDSGPGVTAIARSTQFLDIYGHNSLPLENQPAKSPKNQTPTWALSLMSRVLKVPDIIYLDPFVWRQATSRSSARCTSRSTKACHTPTCSTREWHNGEVWDGKDGGLSDSPSRVIVDPGECSRFSVDEKACSNTVCNEPGAERRETSSSGEAQNGARSAKNCGGDLSRVARNNYGRPFARSAKNVVVREIGPSEHR